MLRRLGGERARAVVVTLTTSGQSVDRTVAYLHARFPDLPIYARARDAIHARRLEELGAEGTVLETLEASLQLGGEVLRRSGTDWQDIEELIRQLRFVDGIAEPIGIRPEGDGKPSIKPVDRVLAAATMGEEDDLDPRSAEPAADPSPGGEGDAVIPEQRATPEPAPLSAAPVEDEAPLPPAAVEPGPAPEDEGGARPSRVAGNA